MVPEYMRTDGWDVRDVEEFLRAFFRCWKEEVAAGKAVGPSSSAEQYACPDSWFSSVSRVQTFVGPFLVSYNNPFGEEAGPTDEYRRALEVVRAEGLLSALTSLTARRHFMNHNGRAIIRFMLPGRDSIICNVVDEEEWPGGWSAV